MMRYKNEKLHYPSHPEVSIARGAVCRHVGRDRFRGHGLVELADAIALRIEADHLLASRRTAHLEQDSFRRIPWQRRARRAPASQHEGTLAAAYAGGAGTIPPKPSCLLEPNGIAGCKANHLIAARPENVIGSSIE